MGRAKKIKRIRKLQRRQEAKRERVRQNKREAVIINLVVAIVALATLLIVRSRQKSVPLTSINNDTPAVRGGSGDLNLKSEEIK